MDNSLGPASLLGRKCATSMDTPLWVLEGRWLSSPRPATALASSPTLGFGQRASAANGVEGAAARHCLLLLLKLKQEGSGQTLCLAAAMGGSVARLSSATAPGRLWTIKYCFCW
ncbi:uncharacterized protein Tco025E_09635 [Trypanosoma conorhini]|uniref:Uncharacterized protein n=1 Tax=Trypanosoma conorhini TaxID=83891 RepID=A0A3R7KAM3_9TRYP|nr:uncharacterized protein Tco025E_09635 [Trypanosoma conorhini]RNE96864.1 hypothetical protein Tco025E_09635 [Trypanosoma conorhini]